MLPIPADHTAIAIRDVFKTYPVPFAGLRRALNLATPTPVAALRGVSLEIRHGEIFGLIGRNGAGKTTLTKILATLVQPTSGTVTVNGFDSVENAVAVRAQIGLATAEERSFYWRLTIEQNLMFFARLYGMTAAAGRTRMEELLELLQLSEVRRRRFGELSTGNKQRVAIVRALLNSPPILLLDEPTRSLDPFAAARLREVVASLARGPKAATILLTSHNLAEIDELCARVAVISGGRIRAIDTPDRLREAHRQDERVQMVCRGVTAAAARVALGQVVSDAEVHETIGGVTVSFIRQSGDATLDDAMRALHQAGATIVSCDAERGTLLDVLETFEREAQRRDNPVLEPAGAGAR